MPSHHVIMTLFAVIKLSFLSKLSLTRTLVPQVLKQVVYLPCFPWTVKACCPPKKIAFHKILFYFEGARCERMRGRFQSRVHGPNHSKTRLARSCSSCTEFGTAWRHSHWASTGDTDIFHQHQLSVILLWYSNPQYRTFHRWDTN